MTIRRMVSQCVVHSELVHRVIAGISSILQEISVTLEPLA